MKINADVKGNILSWGIETIGVEYTGIVPDDFTNGKYLFIDGSIILNENYVETVIQEV